VQHLKTATPEPAALPLALWPRRLMTLAAVAIALAFAALTLAGGRACVGVLSGTMPATWAQAALGLAYVAAYFAAVLVAPVLVAAPAALRLTAAWRGARGRS
jgi:hypothetical protein